MSFFFQTPATTDLYSLSLHDALPICPLEPRQNLRRERPPARPADSRTPPRQHLGAGVGQRLRRRRAAECGRSEEHTSELQSRPHLVCRLLLEKKNNRTRAR